MKSDKRELLAFFGARPLEFAFGFRHRVVPGEYCHFHAHAVFEIVYHPQGMGTTTLKSGQKVAFQDGGAVIYPPYMEHDQRMATSGEDLCIHARHEGPLPALLQSCLYVPAIDDEYVRLEMQALCDARAAQSSLQKIALDHRVTALLVRLIQLCPEADKRDTESPADRYSEAARRIIKDSIEEISRIEEVAQRVGVSHDYLRHIFKERVGMSLAAWLNHCRVERAKELLAHTPLPLKAIATCCGFENERYFCFVFKKHQRCRPGEFRRNHR